MVRAAFGAVVLAGGAARRLGGADKPGTLLGGRSLLDRVLDAVGHAAFRVVVGPPRAGLPRDVWTGHEDPPGAGPVAAAAAGLATAGIPIGATSGGSAADRPAYTALLAADLPYLTAEAVDRLLAVLTAATPADVAPPDDAAPPDGAVYLDDAGRPQWLCGVWRTASLVRRFHELGRLPGLPVRALVAGLTVAEVRTAGDLPPPWFDCDTHDDLRQAREWRT